MLPFGKSIPIPQLASNRLLDLNLHRANRKSIPKSPLAAFCRLPARPQKIKL